MSGWFNNLLLSLQICFVNMANDGLSRLVPFEGLRRKVIVGLDKLTNSRFEFGFKSKRSMNPTFKALS
jgi:hypothetical protein